MGIFTANCLLPSASIHDQHLRIDRRFSTLRQEGRKALVTPSRPAIRTPRRRRSYWPAGCRRRPDRARHALLRSHGRRPGDQASSLRALKAGHKMRKTPDLVRRSAGIRTRRSSSSATTIRLRLPARGLSRRRESRWRRRAHYCRCTARPTRSSACRPSRGLNSARYTHHGRQAPAGGVGEHVRVPLLCFHYRHYGDGGARRGGRSFAHCTYQEVDPATHRGRFWGENSATGQSHRCRRRRRGGGLGAG